MQILLDKLELIKYKYDKFEEFHLFNVFEILQKKSDEVNLHSKFIFELLNPDGRHNLGDKFTKLFLKIIDLQDFDLENFFVKKEYKNIDIILRNQNQAIIIENKIWSGDQERQLERYYEIIEKEGIKDIRLIYLTLHGNEPTGYGSGKLVEGPTLKIISYLFEIDRWLEHCIEASTKHPTLRETIIQYQNLINNLTGQNMEQEQKNEIVKLLSQNENIIKASLIAKNWKHVAWTTEYEFWTDFIELIQQKYKILDYQKFNSDKLDSMIHKTRNRFPWYGIMFNICVYKGHKINLYIERGFENLYYGLTIIENEERLITDSKDFDEIVKELNELFDWPRESRWLGGKYLEPRIDFEKFADENTLILLNVEKRAAYLRENWKKIEEFISRCDIIFSNSN
jgi:hypothetical protein